MAKVLGIDLGTTNSCMSVMEGGDPVVLENSEGARTTPSVVAFTKNGERLVGQAAKRQAVTNPQNTIFSIKRFMGRKFDEVMEEQKRVPYKIVKAANGDAHVQVEVSGERKTFSPPEISAMILSKLKADAEAKLGEKIAQAVITVPAYFNDSQRNATKDAGKIAGLEVLRIINEPTAASLAYGLDKKKDEKIAVYDLGGGTFDISILRVEDGVFQVLSTNGDTHLGGDDIDRLLVEMVLEEVGRAGPAGAALPGDSGPAVAIEAIRRAAIQAKWDLSDVEETEIRIDPSAAIPAGYRQRITRADFERLIRPLIERTLEPCRQALADAGLEAKDIDEAVLVGGSTRIPLVRRVVEELFARTPHSELNPDEVVALGAAVQADILISGRREMLLLDVTPLSLGIETMGGVVSKIIMRNSTIPASGREMFTTGVDNQTGVDIHVVQGERELVADNRSLAHLHLKGIPPMVAGLPRIEVRFQIDANGILSVAARELRTGIEQTIEVKPSYGLTDQEVERMLIESFEHAEADFEARLLIEARNEAESVIQATEKVLRRADLDAAASGLLEPGERARIDTAIAELKAVMDGSDRAPIQDKTHALNHATQHLAEATMNRTVREALAGRNVKDV